MPLRSRPRWPLPSVNATSVDLTPTEASLRARGLGKRLGQGCSGNLDELSDVLLERQPPTKHA